jgi:hypothetical protein
VPPYRGVSDGFVVCDGAVVDAVVVAAVVAVVGAVAVGSVVAPGPQEVKTSENARNKEDSNSTPFFFITPPQTSFAVSLGAPPHAVYINVL